MINIHKSVKIESSKEHIFCEVESAEFIDSQKTDGAFKSMTFKTEDDFLKHASKEIFSWVEEKNMGLLVTRVRRYYASISTKLGIMLFIIEETHGPYGRMA